MGQKRSTSSVVVGCSVEDIRRGKNWEISEIYLERPVVTLGWVVLTIRRKLLVVNIVFLLW